LVPVSLGTMPHHGPFVLLSSPYEGFTLLGIPSNAPASLPRSAAGRPLAVVFREFGFAHRAASLVLDRVSAAGAKRANIVRAIGRVVGVVVIAYACVLRFDAISQQYDAVSSPRWLAALQEVRHGPSVLRPRTMQWTRSPRFPHRDGPPTQYRSDPYTYLQRARQMHAFYGAHVREPLFPFVTKVALWFLRDQDVAVSMASAFFSVVAVCGTLALGAMSFSYVIGLAAALLLTVEYDVITVGTQGWRDDAYMAAFVWCTVGLLAFVRRPSRGRAIALGIVAGGACLIRITAVSFLLPGWIWIIATADARSTRHLRRLALASIVAAVLVLPYLVNCWRAFGDPFYAINAHAAVYQATEDPSQQMRLSAGQFLREHVAEHPWRMFDTVALGMTAYPVLQQMVWFRPLE
jgi:hypothetical protein